MTASPLDRTRRHLTALDGIYRRMDGGQNTGRNAAATDSAVDMHWRELAAALDDGGFEELDSRPRLAAKYARLERRRYVGREA